MQDPCKHLVWSLLARIVNRLETNSKIKIYDHRMFYLQYLGRTKTKEQ